MVYYQDEEMLIRDMETADAQVFYDEYTAQGWHPEVEYYLMRIREQAEGKCVALAAVYQGRPAGAVYVYFDANEGPSKERAGRSSLISACCRSTSARALAAS